ncbi:MAG TPA: secretin N-terminal domain-containing protein [Pirellulales bacterium]|nr:secretin N-terminal domain-containing protein [Pirellulales bacterium]
MPRAVRFKFQILAACFAAAWLLLVTAPIGAQNRQRFGQGGPPDPARMEEFRKRMQAFQQGAKPDDEKKADGEKKDDQAKPDVKEPPKDEGPPPVQRPLRPRRPADPSELEVVPDDDGKISFSFKGQPWPSVLEWLADVSHMSLSWEEAPAGYLELTTRGKYTVDEVRDLLNSVLLHKGFTLLRNGEVLIVANLKKLDPGFVPRVTVDELDERGNYEPVKVFFDLDWLVAENAVEEVKPLLSSFGKATALKATNRLDVLDTAGNLRKIRELLSEEQSDTGQQRLVREFKLRHTRAAEVLETLNTLLGIEPKGAAGQADPRQMFQAMQQMGGGGRNGGGGGGRNGGGGFGGFGGRNDGGDGGASGGETAATPQAQRKESPVYLAVNRRENSILAYAPPDKMAVIEQTILAIDVAQDREGSLLGGVQRMQVYRLAGISPEALVNVLKEMGGLDPTTKLEVDTKSRALIAYAPLVDHVMIRALVEKLDGTARKFEVVQLRTLSAEYVAGSIITLMQGPEKPAPTPDPWSRRFGAGDTSQNENFDKFWVEADVDRNRLLLRANEVELAEVKALLVKLGEIPSNDRNNLTRRLVPGSPGEETDEFLQRLQRVWQRVSPNPLEIDIGDSQPMKTKRPTRRQGDGRRSAAPDAQRVEPPAERATDARDHRRDPRYRLAQERQVKPRAPANEDDDQASSDIEAGETSKASRPAAQVPRRQPPGVEDDDGASSEVEAGEASEGRQPPADEDDDGAGRENEPPADDRALPPEARAPVKITVEPDGIVISSSDTDALDRLEELWARLVPTKMTYKVFPLKHIDSVEMVLLLRDFFREQATSSGRTGSDAESGGRSSAAPSRATLGRRKALSFVYDSRTNTVLVQGADESQLEEIKSLIDFYDVPEPANSESVRRTKRVPLRYAKAKETAELVKDVYRDLLSPNDRALVSGVPQRQQPDGSSALMSASYPSADTSRTGLVPRFKGLLSVGVDERANGLVLSAPQSVLTEVIAMVAELDAAARSTRPVIKLLRVKGAGTSALVKQAVAPEKSEATAGQANAAQANAGPAPAMVAGPGGTRANGQPSTGAQAVGPQDAPQSSSPGAASGGQTGRRGQRGQ